MFISHSEDEVCYASVLPKILRSCAQHSVNRDTWTKGVQVAGTLSLNGLHWPIQGEGSRGLNLPLSH